MKTIKVNDCSDCPYNDYDSKGWVCGKEHSIRLASENRIIPPPDCPLEDVKEEDVITKCCGTCNKFAPEDMEGNGICKFSEYARKKTEGIYCEYYKAKKR